MNETLRKPTEEEKKEFDKVDKKLDEVKAKRREQFKEEAELTNVSMKEKIFMKISDVEPNDARWFKEFCDKHTDRKQFLGIKVIRTIMERLDPILTNVLVQINHLNDRIDQIEMSIQAGQPEEQKGHQIPRPMGWARKEREKLAKEEAEKEIKK